MLQCLPLLNFDEFRCELNCAKIYEEAERRDRDCRSGVGGWIAANLYGACPGPWAEEMEIVQEFRQRLEDENPRNVELLNTLTKIAVGGGATLSQKRLEHIVFRHWSTSDVAGAGKFSRGTTARSLRDMIDDTVAHGSFRPNTNNRPGTIFELDFGRTIGTNIDGEVSSTLRVVVNEDAEVVTAFPI